MKKRGIFSLVVLLALSTLFAAQTTTTAIGTAYELVISDVAFAQAETNNSSSVSVITRAQIEAYNVQSTGELVNKAIGTNFNSYGALGALQKVTIRGAGSAKHLVFLDGILLTSAHEGTVDLSIIPVSTIERIEIIKSGSGNLGRTNAIGGMVNIITKQGTTTAKPFTFSVENGSFLPEAYGASDDRNWPSLVDSQKMDLTYANSLQGTNLVANIGGIFAQNAYTYDGTTSKDLRDNAEIYEVHGSINANRYFGENVEASSNNLANYKHLNLPGSLLGPSPTDYQEDILLSTKNSVTLSNLGDTLESVKADFNYNYLKTFAQDASNGDGEHNKNKGNFLLEGTWKLGEAYNIVTGTDLTLDYVDSNKVGKKLRFTPALYAHTSIYLLEGVLSIHPSISLAYISDLKTFSPSASLGAIYNITENNALKINVSYAEDPLTFTTLYWGGSDNSFLKPEKGIQGDLGFTTTLRPLTYEGTVFARNIYNAIEYDPNTYIPSNIAHSVYFGTEQAVTLDLNDMFSLSASYLYNKSYNLSEGNTFSSNVDVEYVRKHSAKISASFAYSIFDAVLSSEYLDAYKGAYGDADPAFVLNLSVNTQVTKDLKVYIAIDNLLNASYELVSGYPMPGTKVRLGGTMKF